MGRLRKYIYKRFWIQVLFVCFSISGYCGQTGANPFHPLKTTQVDKILYEIGYFLQKRIQEFVFYVDASPNWIVSIQQSFYDSALRRVFIEFKGEVLLPDILPEKLLKDNFQASSDGMVAFDLFCERPSLVNGRLSIKFHGDVVIFLEKVLYELVKETALVAGAISIHTVSDTLIDFLKCLNSKVLAEAFTKAIAGFSKEAISVTGAEIIQRALKANNPKLAELVRKNIKDGTILTFIALNILKSTSLGFASICGGSLGAVVGTALFPVDGGMIGAFIGAKISSSIVKITFQKATVELPIVVYMNRIAKHHKATVDNKLNSQACAKFEKYQEFIITKIRKEVDANRYSLLDNILEKIDEYSPNERQAFIALVKKMQEILKFKLIDQNDWYASKKLLQMRTYIQKWGWNNYFSY